MEIGSKNEGVVKNLAERVKKGEISPKEAKKKMKERGLAHHNIRIKGVILGLCLIFSLLLIYFSTFAKLSGLEFLSFFAQLPGVDFFFFIKLLAIVILDIGFVLLIYASRLLKTKGGLNKGDDTLKFIREGPYAIMRHPISFGVLGLFIWPSYIFSNVLHYTIISPFAQFALIIILILMTMEEDKMNLRKWGDEYRQYMKEVPRWNLIKWLWILRKRKRKRIIKKEP